MFNPKINQSSKNELNLFLLPIRIPKEVPIIIAITNDTKTLLSVINVWNNNSELLYSAIILFKTLKGPGNKVLSIRMLNKYQSKKKESIDTILNKALLFKLIIF